MWKNQNNLSLNFQEPLKASLIYIWANRMAYDSPALSKEK